MSLFFLKYLAKLPFRVLYLLSGVLYFAVFRIARYRKKVVLENLRNAFPEKQEHEIREICKRFYRHFSDLTLEIIKMHNMNAQEFNQRVEIKNAGRLARFYEQKRSMVVLTMHYSNWEWSSFIPTRLRHKSIAVYKPLHNKKYNAYINENRQRFGAEMIPTHHVLRRVVKARERNEIFALWLAGDQTPPLHHTFWLTFLNREALFYQGPAAISRRFNYPVVFQKTTRNGQGKYEISFEVLIENPEDYSESQIMKTYIQKMEETIKEQPEYYLWSHKRWKHKRPDGVPLQD